MTPAEELLKEIIQMTDNVGIQRKVVEYFRERGLPIVPSTWGENDTDHQIAPV